MANEPGAVVGTQADILARMQQLHPTEHHEASDCGRYVGRYDWQRGRFVVVAYLTRAGWLSCDPAARVEAEKGTTWTIEAILAREG